MALRQNSNQPINPIKALIDYDSPRPFVRKFRPNMPEKLVGKSREEGK